MSLERARQQLAELQEELRDRHLAGRGRDTVLLLEHPDVITFGRGAEAGTVPSWCRPRAAAGCSHQATGCRRSTVQQTSRCDDVASDPDVN